MNRVKRLVSDRPTSLERTLLDAALKERPSETQRNRVRRAMMDAAPASVRTAAGTITTRAIFAGVASVGLAGLLLWQRAHTPAPSVEEISAASMLVPAAAVERGPVVAQRVAPDPMPANEPTALPEPARVIAAGVAKARVAARAPSAASETSDVRDQIRMIDEARAAMDRHNAPAALASVDRYAAKYPDGIFRQEGHILRILALDERGDHARASALAKAFLASYPNSAHVSRIERIAKH